MRHPASHVELVLQRYSRLRYRLKSAGGCTPEYLSSPLLPNAYKDNQACCPPRLDVSERERESAKREREREREGERGREREREKGKQASKGEREREREREQGRGGGRKSTSSITSQENVQHPIPEPKACSAPQGASLKPSGPKSSIPRS